MATVIYLPKITSIGDAFGMAAGQLTGNAVRQDREKTRKEEKAKKLGALFDGIMQGGEAGTAAARGAITSGAITEEGDLINLLGQLRKNRTAGNIKVDAFTKDGNKTSFALNKVDLTTGAGEKNANAIGLTLVNPGKTVDYYDDNATMTFVGSSGDRMKGKLTFDEWKVKHDKTSSTTDKDSAIGDYLKGSKDVNGATLQNTASNRKRAREFLDKRGKAVEVINTAFGKKTGQDWTIDDPIKNQMAVIAKQQVEGFIMAEGMSAEQAGAAAVNLAREVLKFQDVESFDNETGKSSTKTINTQTNKEYLGDLNGQDIEVPQEITEPKQALDYIMSTYKLSRPDALQFLFDNAPSE